MLAISPDKLKVVWLDFDPPQHLEWKPADPLDADVWATADVGDERGSVSFQLHICTSAAMKRVENKRHCFTIEGFIDRADLVARLDVFILEKTSGCVGDPYRVLGKFWRWEYGKYDKRGNLIG